MRWRCAAGAWLLALVPAQAPVEVGAGPLVCCQVYDGASTARVHLVAQPDGGRPREFWRTPENSAVLRRLDRTRVVGASYGAPYALMVLDLARGTARVLADGAPHGFVGVHGDDVLYVGDGRARGPLRPDDYLYAAPWREPGPPRRLCDARLAQVPIVAGNLAFGIGADGREVWAISLVRAQGRRLHTLPDGDTRGSLALSPNGARLAVGSVDGRGRGRLAVVDAATGAAVARWDDLPIDLSPLSSFSATLLATWTDDTHVLCSETRADRRAAQGAFVHVTRDVASGDVVDEVAYAELGLYHELPAPPPPPPPAFAIVSESAGRDGLQPPYVLLPAGAHSTVVLPAVDGG